MCTQWLRKQGARASAVPCLLSPCPSTHPTHSHVALAWRTQVGKVVECYVVRDKGTSESKGSAFIWYVNKAQADAAVEHFNNRHTLPDPTGEMVGSRCGAALGPVEGAAEGALQQNYLQQQQHPCE